MRSTFKVLFYLKKGRETTSGEVMIMARITVNGEQCQFSTKQKIAPNLWSVEATRAIGRTKEVQKINLLLDDIKANIIRIYHDMQLTDNYVTAEKVRNRFMGSNEDCATILELFQKHNEDVKSLIGITKSKSTYQKYEVARRHISEFIRFKYNMSDMYVNEITPMFIDNFKVYMMTVGKCGENTTSKFLQSFKRIVIIARDNGFLKTDPFANHKIRMKKVDRGYLTEQEIEIMVKKKFELERLSQVRDIFLFSCFCGLAYIDLKNLTQDNITTVTVSAIPS